jgi:hypothetical protein
LSFCATSTVVNPETCTSPTGGGRLMVPSAETRRSTLVSSGISKTWIASLSRGPMR